MTQCYCQPCLEEETKKISDESKAGHLSKVHRVAVGTATGNLKVHLSKYHNVNIDCDRTVEKQQGILRNWITSSKPATSCYEINRELIMWFCKDLKPFSMVEDAGFVKFFKENVGADLPTRSGLSQTPLCDV